MKVGLRKIFVAKYSVNESGVITYSDGKCIAKATKLDVNPEFYSQEFYADDGVDDIDNGFKKASLGLGINGLDAEDEATLFGYTYTAGSEGEGAKVVSINTSEPSEVGVGCIITQRKSGVVSYVATIFHRAKFTEGSSSVETKGENVKMDAEQLNGVAISYADGKLRTKEYFSSYQAAESAVKTFLSIT